MKCSELTKDSQVVFKVDPYYQGNKQTFDGSVLWVNKDNRTVCVSYLEGYKDRSDDIPFEDMIAVYDQLMEEIGIREQIENIYTKFMFANYTGICVEDGIMWINIDSSGDYKITAINPPSYYITELYAD